MTRVDKLRAVFLATIMVLSVASAAGPASAEVSQQDPQPVDLIQVDGDAPDLGVVNNSNNGDRADLPRVQSANGPQSASTVLVRINVTNTDRVNITLTNNTNNPARNPFASGAAFGVNGTEDSISIADGDSNDLSSGNSAGDGVIVAALEIDSSNASYVTGDELTVVVDDSGSFTDGAGNRETIEPAVVVDNRLITISGPINDDTEPDVVDANNPRPDIVGQTDNDADGDEQFIVGDEQFTVHSREQAKVVVNLTRDGPVQIANATADVSNLSTTTEIPLSFDADGDGQISESEEGRAGPNGTYIGQFYVNDTNAISNFGQVEVTVTDTVGTVTSELNPPSQTTEQAFAGIGVGNAVSTGAPPDPDIIDDVSTTSPDRDPGGASGEQINYYVYGQEGDNKVTVVFQTELDGDEDAAFPTGIFSEDDGTGSLGPDDFEFIDNDREGATSIQSVDHEPGTHTAVLTLDQELTEDDVVGTSPSSDEIRLSAGQVYIASSVTVDDRAESNGNVYPLAATPSQARETDQSIFPTNVTSISASPKDPPGPRSVGPEDQINVTATFDVFDYGQAQDETQAAVSFRATDTSNRSTTKQAFEDALIDGAVFSGETQRVNGDDISVARGDRISDAPDGQIRTTLNLDAFPPGGASGGPLTVDAEAYGLYDLDDNPDTIAPPGQVDVDAVRPTVLSATNQPGATSTQRVNGVTYDTSRVIEVTFSEPVQDNDGNSLDRDDFTYNDNNGGAGSIVSVGHTAGNEIVKVVMNESMNVSDLNNDNLEVAPNQIVDADSIEQGEGPTNFVEIGNTARDGLDQVNRTERIDIQLTSAAPDPAVNVFPDPVKGDDSIIVTTEQELTSSTGQDVLLQVVDANGNNLDPDDNGNFDAIRVTDGGRNDLDGSADGLITTRILLTDMIGDEADEGALTVQAEASLTSGQTSIDSPDATSNPTIVDNTRPTVVGVFPSNSDEVTVQFSEGVYARELSRERLTQQEFSYDDNNQGGATAIEDSANAVQHTPGSATVTIKLNSEFTTGGPNSDQAEDKIGFVLDKVEDEAGNTLIPGSESVGVGDRQIDQLLVSTESADGGGTDIAVKAQDNGDNKTGVTTTFTVVSGSGIFSNGQSSVTKTTQFTNSEAQAIATLNGTGTVEISAGGQTTTIQVGDGGNGGTDPGDGDTFTEPLPGDGDSAQAPTDPDGDGQFEDVDGDGTADFDDAVALAFADTSQLSAEQRDALDFDGDGDVDFDDAIELAFSA